MFNKLQIYNNNTLIRLLFNYIKTIQTKIPLNRLKYEH